VLTSADSPLESGPLTPSQASWIGAFLCVGGFTGTIIFGWLADVLGRKLSTLILAFPEMVSRIQQSFFMRCTSCLSIILFFFQLSWLLIIFSKDASYFIASRFFSGFGGGGAFVMIPMFVAEISEDRVRGRLGSMLVLSCNIGILFAYVAGYFVNYVESACIMLPIPIVFFIGFLFFPDTPTYLVKAKKFTVMFSYIKSSRYF
jgi:MFS family permease